MPAIHLKQQGYTYSTCARFDKNKEWIKKQKKHETPDLFIKNNQIKLGFNKISVVDILKI